jgi:GNAT superfamily N-acetyltransferase
MLTPVEIKDFDKLEGIIKRNIELCNVGKRTSFEYVKATATLFAAQGNVGIWVDDLENPGSLLIVTSGKFGVLNETFAFVNTIYADKQYRNRRVLKEMIDTALLWSRSKNCETLQVSSWVYQGCDDTSSVWKSFGFDIQETIYVKTI